ncbi:SusE domain-containing protein [Aquimarina latercula]|uniref:SusE domain-containing protein n=1 Tax=Aquimarina latercula TaxID=987 RepID=UPI000429E493|nr:SusE domain-containing protein [Aquimarina latercula]
MKYLYKTFIIITALLFSFSCTDDDRELKIATTQESSEVLLTTNSANSDYIITATNTDEIADLFSWDEANFGFNAQVNYKLLVDSEGGDFSQAQSLGSTTATEIEITYGNLNQVAIALGLQAGISNTLLFKVEASISQNVQKIDSQVLSKEITTYEVPVELLDYFLVGDATAAGWDNDNNNTPLFRDPENPAIFYFNGYFSVGKFKVLTKKGQWHPQIGSDDGATLVASNPDGSGEPQNLGDIVVEGYYSLMFNTANYTYTFEPLDASSVTSYGTIGIIGSARTGDAAGWDEPDTDMTQVSSLDNHMWYVSGQGLLEGNLKFRADDAWDIDWGSNTPLSGVATMNVGDDISIPVSSGNYDIWFNDIDGRYIFIPNE